MSDRTRTKNNTNTAQINTLLADPLKVQIAEVLSREELSTEELSEILHKDEKKVAHDLELLEKSHIITKHSRGRHETYAVLVPQVKETIHILYGLWADSVRSPYEYAEVNI
jgi:DNA-binding transcriptional ArsR family regulator